VRLRDEGLESYLVGVAELLERYGLELEPGDRELTIDQAGDARRLELRAVLPDAATQTRAIVELRETWVADGTGGFVRAEYAYKLLDRPRGFRRAFHLHDPDWFGRRFLVVVHEHCERPIGVAPCDHVEGSPIRDAFAGAMRLIEVWADSELPDCAALPCLDR